VGVETGVKTRRNQLEESYSSKILILSPTILTLRLFKFWDPEARGI
jgi:hypothetical protein